MVTNLKNSHGDKTEKLKLWQNPKTQIVTNLKKNEIVAKHKNSMSDKTKKKTQIVTNHQLWKTQIKIKLKIGQKSNCDYSKIKIVTKLKN